MVVFILPRVAKPLLYIFHHWNPFRTASTFLQI